MQGPDQSEVDDTPEEAFAVDEPASDDDEDVDDDEDGDDVEDEDVDDAEPPESEAALDDAEEGVVRELPEALSRESFL